MPHCGIHTTLSTNWKPGSAGSKRTHSTTDSTNTIRLVHSAVQRAFAATVASSPRTDMMIRPPSSGSHVSSESRGKPAAFMVSPQEEQEDADQRDKPDQHGKGVGGERPGLQLHRLGGTVQSERGQSVRDAVDDLAVADLPQDLCQCDVR